MGSVRIAEWLKIQTALERAAKASDETAERIYTGETTPEFDDLCALKNSICELLERFRHRWPT